MVNSSTRLRVCICVQTVLLATLIQPSWTLNVAAWSQSNLRTARNSVVGNTTDGECENVDCSWTSRWSCPGWTPGSKGVAFNDGSVGFKCCCASLLQHAGEDCWNPCGKRGGTCAWCGQGNACCRRGAQNPPECQGVTEYFTVTDVHECVTPALTEKWASVFVVIFSRRDAFDRRTTIRSAWTAQNGESGNSAKFAICEDAAATFDSSREALQAEQERYGDLLFLDCPEGYYKGALTKKVLASMNGFMKNATQSLFMKVDDDTFVAWRRLAPFLARRGHANAYVGVPIDVGVPCRNASKPWYEPWTTFAREQFPRGMGGGSGYVLGRTLVDQIISRGIADANMLWNEDRAVGVWVETLEKAGVPTEHVPIRGIDGFWRWNWRSPMENWHTWGEYPFLVHHGLNGSTIDCLFRADAAGDASLEISGCFRGELGKQHEKLTCYTEH